MNIDTIEFLDEFGHFDHKYKFEVQFFFLKSNLKVTWKAIVTRY